MLTGSRARKSDRQQVMLHDLYGPWAVVTGASDGIGRAFAEHLAEAGFSLVLVARRGDVLQDLARDLTHRFQTPCQVVACDLSQTTSIAQVAAATQFLDVGMLVAAAGFGTSGPFLDNDLDAERAMVEVNCRAVMELVHLFGARMRVRGSGGIVLMSSLVAFQGVPRASHYAATKAYVQGLAEGLWHELRPAGIDVLAVAPGPIQSGFAARANMTLSMSQTPDVVAKGALAALGRKSTVRPGWLSTLLEGSLAPLPRRARTLIMGRVMAGMTSLAQR